MHDHFGRNLVVVVLVVGAVRTIRTPYRSLFRTTSHRSLVIVCGGGCVAVGARGWWWAVRFGSLGQRV